MPEMSRSQVVVYAAVAVALLLVGARAIRGEGGDRGFVCGRDRRGSAVRASRSAAQAATWSSTSPAPCADPASTGCRRAAGSTTPLPAPAAPRRGRELEAINLAARLADGQQVVVPERAPGGGAASRAGGEEGPISLGTATAEQLEEIEGIGPVTAGDIIDFRDEHGGLSSIDQLDQVPGIGPATMESLRARLQP